jgi:ATP phosphoribosyltransferase regulatory subunit HisZ
MDDQIKSALARAYDNASEQRENAGVTGFKLRVRELFAEALRQASAKRLLEVGAGNRADGKVVGRAGL